MTETGDNASELQQDIARLEADLRPDPVEGETENVPPEPVSPATGQHVHLPG